MEHQTLLVEHDAGIATIVLNRPKHLNALSQQMIGELLAAFDRVAGDDVRAVIVTGADDRAFAAGADISELAQLESPSSARRMALRSHQLGRKMAELPKPIIAAINGYALGGGLELALACDIRVMSDTAQIGLPEVSLGILPGWGGTQRLPRLVGPGMAKLLMLSGERIGADEALRIGVVERVYPHSELRDAATRLAHTLAGMPPLSVAAIKQAVHHGMSMTLADANAFEAGLFGELATTEDAREGTRAFLEKRQATWKGR